MSSRAQLYLIDGSSQMYRAYHAIRGLTGPDGRSTNAVYGFVTMLRKLIVDHVPSTSGPPSTWRRRRSARSSSRTTRQTGRPCPRISPSRSRSSTRPARRWACPSSRSRASRPTTCSGTLARQAAARGPTVAIVTGDKDFFQLVDEHLLVFNPRDEGTWYDAEGVLAKFGVQPGRVVDVLALMGDAIDNVKGVPGIGEKGARELIAAHGSLDALLARAGELTAEEVPRGAPGPRRRGAPEPRAGAHPHRRARHARSRRAAVPGRAAGALLRPVLDARFPLAHRRVRADRGRGGRATTHRDHAPELEALDAPRVAGRTARAASSAPPLDARRSGMALSTGRAEWADRPAGRPPAAGGMPQELAVSSGLRRRRPSTHRHRRRQRHPARARGPVRRARTPPRRPSGPATGVEPTGRRGPRARRAARTDARGPRHRQGRSRPEGSRSSRSTNTGVRAARRS